eukprot:TRINITY_DN1684_c0_g1_i6.p1 TRINITY_DN1684_c0_g1~~TRINITY_DN1684_c0_g1_i6.p1  ORF type:complete len:376 (-),score=76.32 TRINITY_DN1684_c0_g1_i6:542-1669(-)
MTPRTLTILVGFNTVILLAIYLVNQNLRLSTQLHLENEQYQQKKDNTISQLEERLKALDLNYTATITQIHEQNGMLQEQNTKLELERNQVYEENEKISKEKNGYVSEIKKLQEDNQKLKGDLEAIYEESKQNKLALEQLKKQELPRFTCTRTPIGYDAHLQCPLDLQKILSIKYATFGQIPDGSCPEYTTREGGCFVDVRDKIGERCLSLSRCTIPVKPLLYPSNCHGELYLVVVAECENVDPTNVLTDLHIYESLPIEMTTTMSDRDKYGNNIWNVEFLPNSFGPVGQQTMEKSLVVIAVGRKVTQYVDKIVNRFGVEHFSYIFFRYDDYSNPVQVQKVDPETNTTITEEVMVNENPYTKFWWYNHIVWISAKK